MPRDVSDPELPTRMVPPLKLVLPQVPTSSQASPPPPRNDSPDRFESPGSPARPSYSPVTPTLSQSALALPLPEHMSQPQDLWMTEPEANSVSLEDNSDAIATRAAIAILQMQRQQSLKDIKILEKTRKAAAEDPDAFVKDLSAGKLTPQARTGIEVDDDDSNSDLEPLDESGESKFDRFPAAQNVVRAPPIEWSKYHIVGGPLDKMHEIQRRYPGFKEEMLDAVQKPQPHTIASPYKPFADKLDDLHKDEYGA